MSRFVAPLPEGLDGVYSQEHSEHQDRQRAKHPLFDGSGQSLGEVTIPNGTSLDVQHTLRSVPRGYIAYNLRSNGPLPRVIYSSGRSNEHLTLVNDNSRDVTLDVYVY